MDNVQYSESRSTIVGLYNRKTKKANLTMYINLCFVIKSQTKSKFFEKIVVKSLKKLLTLFIKVGTKEKRSQKKTLIFKIEPNKVDMTLFDKSGINPHIKYKILFFIFLNI
jgi:hypothetical protein